MHRLACAALLLLPGELFAAGQCRTFDRTPACCPHPPPVCCPAEMAAPIDDALVHAVCGPSEAKGESYSLEECNRFYGTKDLIGQISFAKMAGGAPKLAAIRKELAGPRATLVDLRVPGAARAFLVRDLDEHGTAERVSLWGLVGDEVVHVAAEVSVCTETQAIALFKRAIERMRR